MRPRREPIRLTVQRRRRDFNQPGAKLADKDAHELWNSSQMECRPFKVCRLDARERRRRLGMAVFVQRGLDGGRGCGGGGCSLGRRAGQGWPPSRRRVVLTFTRPWLSPQDPNFDMRRMEQDVGTQVCLCVGHGRGQRQAKGQRV